MDSNIPTPSTSRSGLSFILLAGVLILAVSIWFFAKVQEDEKSQVLRLARESLEKQKEKASSVDENVRAEKEAISKAASIGRNSNWKRFAAKNQELRKELASAELENKKRLEAEAALMDSTKGAFLVGDDLERSIFVGLKDKFAQVSGLLEQVAISTESYEATSQQMLALNHPGSDVSAEDFAKIVANVEQVRKTIVELKAANQYLSKLLAKGSVAGSPASSVTNLASLREKIDHDEAARIAKNALERQTELQSLREQEEQKLRGVLKEQEKARLEKERELVQLQFKNEMQEKDKEIEAAKIAADKKLQTLKQANLVAEQDKALEADLERVKTLLAPFIAKARNQFTPSGHMAISDEECPVSLRALEGHGALKPNLDGVVQLQNAALAVSREGGRPLGGFDTNIFDRSSAQESQRLLRVHGAAMVRAGLLAP